MANDLVIRVAAVDNATKVVQKVQGSLNRMIGPTQKLTQHVASLGSKGAESLEKFNSGLRKASSIALALSDRVASVIPGLAAIAGVLGGAGIATIAEKWGTLGRHLQITGRELGMSTRSLQSWHYAARQAGVSADQFDQSIASSQETIRKAFYGGDPQARSLLTRLGVNISVKKNGRIDYEKTQKDLLAALGKIKDPVGQRTATAAMGMSGLLPMIQRGTYNADRLRAVNLGLVMSDRDIEKAAAFKSDLTDLEQTTEGLSNTIGSRLIPVLDPMVTKFSEWLNSHRADIAEKLAASTQKFSDWINSVNWGALYDNVNKIVDKLGGISTIFTTLVGIKLASTVMGWAGAIGELAGKLVAATAAVKGLKAVTVGEGVATAAEGGAAIGAGTVIAGGTVAAGIFAAPIAYGASRLYHNMTETEAGIKQRIADRQARVDELNQLMVADPRNADRYAAERAGIQKTLDAYRGRLKMLESGAANHVPLGIRSNNPLNLQPGGVESVYDTPEEGIAAAADNLRRNYSGLTVAQMARKWTGGGTPAEVGNYVRLLERGTGLSANQRPDLSDPSLVAALFKAQIRAENGQQPYTDAQILSGVQSGLFGRSGSSEQPGGGGQSNVHELVDALDTVMQKRAVHVTVHAPQGTSVDARHANGDYLPIRVNRAMGPSAGIE